MKNIIIAIIVLALVGFGIYFFTKDSTPKEIIINDTNTPLENASTTPMQDKSSVLGKSVQGRDITAYHFGTGETELLFIGGIHGGYEWNTSLVAYEMIDYLEANESSIPSNIKVTVIPVLNPDGLYKVVGKEGRFVKSDAPTVLSETVSGRFNANNVDLNRNFDCDWQASATWQNKTVSGGSKAFSEPESLAIKSYVESNKPSAVVVWYSAVGGVFASNCHSGVLAETTAITKAYADASGYKAYNEFNFYEITGDMVNWFAKINIPAISVLLTNHTDTEWTKNQKGILAIFNHYAK